MGAAEEHWLRRPAILPANSTLGKQPRVAKKRKNGVQHRVFRWEGSYRTVKYSSNVLTFVCQKVGIDFIGTRLTWCTRLGQPRPHLDQGTRAFFFSRLPSPEPMKTATLIAGINGSNST
jgi:hypothetical protein